MWTLTPLGDKVCCIHSNLELWYSRFKDLVISGLGQVDSVQFLSLNKRKMDNFFLEKENMKLEILLPFLLFNM